MILDIFAQNARTQEGKAQVELAQLRYRLPRLRGRGKALSQQAGGIGTRGPGETQLEVDRRRLVRRMTKLEAELRGSPGHRRLQRKARARSRLSTVSLVGYTNAGKSTLLNHLTDAGVLVEDRLFATLDPRTRRLALPGGESVLLSDTVGFVRKLPHQLVEAFRSTLEVVTESDLLVHVVDSIGRRSRGPDRGGAHRAGRDRRRRGARAAGVQQGRRDPRGRSAWPSATPGSVVISALTGEGIDELLAGGRRPAAGPGRRSSSWSSPTSGATCWPRSTARARCWWSATRRRAARAAGPDGRGGRGPVPGVGRRAGSGRGQAGRLTTPSSGSGPVEAGAPGGFVPPAYPYDRLDAAKAKAAACPGGVVDLSVGTPTDPPPPAVLAALAGADSGHGPGLPRLGRLGRPAPGHRRHGSSAASASTVPPRRGRRLRGHQGVRGDAAPVAPAADARARHRPVPGDLLPDLRDGGHPGRAVGRCRCRSTPAWRLDLAAVDEADAARALVLWVNTPGNPAGHSTTSRPRPRWGRERGVPVFSDECYAEFTWDGPPAHRAGPGVGPAGLEGVVAVHSLSKRSNLAGLRAGLVRRGPRAGRATCARCASTSG